MLDSIRNFLQSKFEAVGFVIEQSNQMLGRKVRSDCKIALHHDYMVGTMLQIMELRVTVQLLWRLSLLSSLLSVIALVLIFNTVLMIALFPQLHSVAEDFAGLDCILVA